MSVISKYQTEDMRKIKKEEKCTEIPEADDL